MFLKPRLILWLLMVTVSIADDVDDAESNQTCESVQAHSNWCTDYYTVRESYQVKMCPSQVDSATVTRYRSARRRKQICCDGWTGCNCDIPICIPQCRNNGVCVGPNKCYCPPGCNRNRCQNCRWTPRPRRNTRLCANGWTGCNCDVPMCNPRCQNNGVCAGPNKCYCQPGYTGDQCQNFECASGCENGGSCVGPDLCSCPEGFIGDTCEISNCTKPNQRFSVDTGKCYEVYCKGYVVYDEAVQHCKNLTESGVQGHLVEWSNKDEEDFARGFVFEAISADAISMWQGARRPPGGARNEFLNLCTGEPIPYTNWDWPHGQPYRGSSIADCVMAVGVSGGRDYGWRWSDQGCHRHHAITVCEFGPCEGSDLEDISLNAQVLYDPPATDQFPDDDEATTYSMDEP